MFPQLMLSGSVSENGRKRGNLNQRSKMQDAQLEVGISLRGDSPKLTISGMTQVNDIWRAKSQTAIAISGIDAHTSCMNLNA